MAVVENDRARTLSKSTNQKGCHVQIDNLIPRISRDGYKNGYIGTGHIFLSDHPEHISIAFLFLAEFQSQLDRHIDEKSPTGTPLSTITHHVVIHLSLIDDGGLQALRVLDVDGLDEGVELLLALLVVVTLTSDADTETVRDTLDAGFPDLLVELGVKADVLGTHSPLSKIPDGLDGARSALLEGNTVQLFPNKKEV